MICSLPYCQDEAWHGETATALCERHFRLAPLSFRRAFQRAMKSFREAEAEGELKPHIVVGWNCLRRDDKWLCMSPAVSAEFYRAQDRLVRVWKRLRREVISELTGTPRFERRRRTRRRA